VLGEYGGIATMCAWVFDEPMVVGRIALVQLAFVLLLGVAIARHKGIGRGHLVMFVSIAVLVEAARQRF
jgi:hypothetical protein